MRIWIDADAAPVEVKEVVFRAAKRLPIEVILVANRPLDTPKALSNVRSVAVSHGANVADQYIVARAESGEIAVTADLPFAAELVAKRVHVINPRGELYTPDTIASVLSMRDFMDELRGFVDIQIGPKPYTAKDKRAFAAAFDAVVTRAVRAREKG